MALWTDIIDPPTLTEYARAEQADYEMRRGGTLARYLPNRTIADIAVRFLAGNTGLQEEARFRSFDAAIEIGPRPTQKRVTLELPAIGQNLPVTEYDQLRLRGGSMGVSDAAALNTILATTTRVVHAIADRMERLRGTVLTTGVATIAQSNFVAADTFNRSASHTIAYNSSFGWDNPANDRLGFLQTLFDLYRDDTGEEPGALLMSDAVYRAFQNGSNLQTTLIGGANRRPDDVQLASLVSAAGLPPIDKYNRRVRSGGANVRVLDNKTLLMLPAAVDPTDYLGTDLGATFWGQTLSSTEAGWAIPEADQPGVVAGVWRDEKPPMGAEVIGDAIGMPVLANADLSIAVQVLP